MVIDRLLPEMDGLTIIETLRGEGIRTPVLVLSALGAVDERVRGLRSGGDDYLTKPFAAVELVARIEALARAGPESPDTVLRVGPLELDLIKRTAKRGERTIELLPREFRLLEYMMRRKDQTLTRAMLLEEVWNYKFVPQTNLVDVHMGRLRHKVDEPNERTADDHNGPRRRVDPPCACLISRAPPRFARRLSSHAHSSCARCCCSASSIGRSSALHLRPCSML